MSHAIEKEHGRIYYVRHGMVTDYEPRAGWYVALAYADEIHGPFSERENAEDWLDNYEGGDT